MLPKLQDFIERNELPNVYLIGRVSNVERYLQASDIFLFPSRKEDFPSGVIQAMSIGLPCVVYDLDGTSKNDNFELHRLVWWLRDMIPRTMQMQLLNY